MSSPSRTYLGVDDQVHAFVLDEALAVRDQVEQRWAVEKNRGRERLPAGQRFESVADLDLSSFDATVPVSEFVIDG